MKSSFTFRIKRRNIRQIIIMYGCFLFYLVFLTPNRYRGTQYKANFIPIYQTIERIHKPEGDHFWPYYIGYWGNLVGNIILFMPFGFLAKWIMPYKNNRPILFYGTLTSILIELLQLLLQIGVCDIDDVLLNTAGVAAGIFIYQKWADQIAIH